MGEVATEVEVEFGEGDEIEVGDKGPGAQVSKEVNPFH